MNIQKLMRQAQQMQETMQRELAELVVEASVGGGMVAVRMSGQKQLLGITIDPEILESRDVAMLQDLILSACNEAGRQVDETMQRKLGALGGGLGLPGFG
jgi:DNA-binding YbaB/EbfC family protein